MLHRTIPSLAFRPRRRGARRSWAALPLLLAALAIVGLGAGSICRADVVFSCDFKTGGFAQQGWKADGPWDLFNYDAASNNPGPVARYPAHKAGGGRLIRSFDPIAYPSKLVLSLDLGWGWGDAGQAADGSEFMLLDPQGDGYVFHVGRGKANWTMQWAEVKDGKPPVNKNWASQTIDGAHKSIRDGGGLEHITLTRDANAHWTLASKDWNEGKGASLSFTDAHTSTFSQVVLLGNDNFDEQAFNRIELSVEPQRIVRVVDPPYCADVKGDVTVKLSAPGFNRLAADCWKPGPGFGSDADLGPVELDAHGLGSFVFAADRFPHGPITIRISGADDGARDTCYLQLYNQGGVSWKEGIPADAPPAARGMKQVFADDFTGPLSIGDNAKSTYYDHKPPHGSQDFSTIPFTNFAAPNSPFKQVDTYLRIRADAKKHSAGLISSLKDDGSGVTAKAPCYFECRFVGPNAIGTWPAFWLLTAGKTTPGGDELDIIEAYGGEGPGEPNAGDTYMITPHAWNQGAAGKKLESQAFNAMHDPIHMRKFGIPSTWFQTPHTYGCRVTEDETIYYCDDIEVGRHKTLPISRTYPFYFLVNLATGGGWPVDLSRYDGRADMYVDYVRVYQGEVGK